MQGTHEDKDMRSPCMQARGTFEDTQERTPRLSTQRHAYTAVTSWARDFWGHLRREGAGSPCPSLVSQGGVGRGPRDRQEDTCTPVCLQTPQHPAWSPVQLGASFDPTFSPYAQSLPLYPGAHTVGSCGLKIQGLHQGLRSQTGSRSRILWRITRGPPTDDLTHYPIPPATETS